MSQTKKRKADTVDLTNDSDTENTSPYFKLAKQSEFSTYATPPASRQPLRASQERVAHASFNRAQNPSPCPSSRQTHPRAERDARSSPPQSNIEGEIARSIDLALDDDDQDAYESRQLYGILYTSIVGIRYYRGEATVGEYVIVRREPGNRYDDNAIRIDNVRRRRMGHIGRNMAATLAPLMDSGELMVEGALTGTKGEFQGPIGLKLFGTTSHPEKWALRSKMLEKTLPVQEFDRVEAAHQKRHRELAKQQASYKFYRQHSPVQPTCRQRKAGRIG